MAYLFGEPLVNIALREGAKQKPEHDKLWQKALRTLQRKEASKFRQKVTSKIKFVQQVTLTGVILSPALSIPIDGLRVIGVVIRIVKNRWQSLRLPIGLRNLLNQQPQCGFSIFFDGIRFFCITQPTGNNLLAWPPSL
jgi:hypothetical protein